MLNGNNNNNNNNNNNTPTADRSGQFSETDYHLTIGFPLSNNAQGSRTVGT
jgi:hypothetical protein